MKCKSLKIRSKKYKSYYYCSILKREIKIDECYNCTHKEYKIYNPLKKRTYMQSKKEKDRFSIIYQDLTKCCVCGSKIGIELNEIFEGAYRQTSIKYGMVAPMCETCHKRFHNDRLFNLYYKKKFQTQFEKLYSHDLFISLFKQDYIYLYKKKKLGNKS